MGGILAVWPGAAAAGAAPMPPMRIGGSLLVEPGAAGWEGSPSGEGAPPIRMVGSVLMAGHYSRIGPPNPEESAAALARGGAVG